MVSPLRALRFRLTCTSVNSTVFGPAGSDLGITDTAGARTRRKGRRVFDSSDVKSNVPENSDSQFE